MGEGSIFTELESEVRIYSRRWPAVFAVARGSNIYDENGRGYLDFFAGAGSLNYGHNHPHLKDALLRYIQADSIVQSLDMATTARREFLEVLHREILIPRGLQYKVQFPGPAGCTAVEAALKLARKYTGRRNVVTFTNSFHGMTLGAISVSGRMAKKSRENSSEVTVIPYNERTEDNLPNMASLERLIGDDAAEIPAAVIVETVQGEGGLHTASTGWLQQLARLCGERGVLLIVDDVQMGCGRTGPFFSFEQADIVPDIVCLSKSLSGYGLPLALTLLRPHLDVWEAGEHTNTFRGPCPAFVTAVAAMSFWRDGTFEQQTLEKGKLVESAVREIAAGQGGTDSGVRGRGMAWGIAFREPGLARRVCDHAFERGLLLETSGPDDEVVKLIPPLTSTRQQLNAGLDILHEAVRAAAGHVPLAMPAQAGAST